MAGLETAMVSSGKPGKLEHRMVVEYGINLDGVLAAAGDAQAAAGARSLGRAVHRGHRRAGAGTPHHALAERHNQAGLHRGTGLTGFLDAIPYEPTVSFPKLPAEGKDHDQRGKTPRDDPA